MSQLLRKSKANLKVAEVTATDGEYSCASVHCSYYSCFQFVKHILDYVLVPAQPVPRVDAHKVAYINIFNAIGQRNPTGAHIFNSKWVPLYTRRLESDYDNVAVTKPEAESALDHARKIHDILTSTFITP